MGLVDAFKRMTGYEAEEVDEEYEEDEAPSKPTLSRSTSFEDDFGIRHAQGSKPTAPGKVFNIPATTRLQLIVVKAEKFTDAAEIADHFKSKRAVLINLDNTNKDVAGRLIDFLGGVAYAADGDLKRVANTSYIIVPCNIDISGDMIEELGVNTADFI